MHHAAFEDSVRTEVSMVVDSRVYTTMLYTTAVYHKGHARTVSP